MKDLSRDVEFINDPGAWPCWPWLPLKRMPLQGSDRYSHAMLYDTGMARVFKFFEGRDLGDRNDPSSFDFSKAEDITARDLVERGWLVD